MCICERIKKFFIGPSPETAHGPASTEAKRWLNVLCFYLFGMLTFFNQEMLLPAAEDLLSGRQLPTSTVLMCFVAPLMITKLSVPWFIQSVSYAVKTCFVALSMSLGLALVGLFGDIKVQLFGIALNAVATGASEMNFLALTSFYPEVCISAFVAGTGMASLFSPNYYTGLTTWSCIPPKTAILITIPLPFLIVFFYALLDKQYINKNSVGPKTHSAIKYTKVDHTSKGEKDEMLDPTKKSMYSEKLIIALKISPFIVALCLNFFSEYLSMSSVVTTIAFPDSNIHLRDHFIYYTLSYGVGKFFGRSYLLLFAFLPSDAIESLKCSRTWILTVLGISHLTFFLFESWYHFVGYIWIIIVLCSTLGLVAGIIVALSPHAVKQHVSPEEGEFALALITVGNGVGSFLAGLVGLFLEPYLTKRCKEHFPTNQEFCMTRMPNSIGWKRNMGC